MELLLICKNPSVRLFLILDMSSTSDARCRGSLLPDFSLRGSVSLPLSTNLADEKIVSSQHLVQGNLSAEESAHCSPFAIVILILRTAGLLTTFVSWRWAYYFQGMLSASFVLAIYFFVPNDVRPVSRREPIDWFGAFLVSAGLCSFCFGLTDADTSSNGWATNYIIISLILGFLGIVLFAWLQSKLRYPLIPPSIWRYPQFPRVILTYFLGFTTFAGVLIFNYTLMWQLVFGRNAIGVPSFLQQSH